MVWTMPGHAVPKVKPPCIYCRANPADSEEHHLPAGLGEFEGYQSLVDRVCVKCNDVFSGFEGSFLRRSPEGLFRLILGIHGRKKHDKKTPFYGRDYKTGPIRILGPLPETGYNVYWEVIPGSGTPPQHRELRQIVVKTQKGEFIPIPIEDYIQTPDGLDDVIAKLGLGKVTIDRLIADPDEQKQLEDLTARIRAEQGGQTSWAQPAHAAIQHPVEAEVQLGEPYWRTIAKIALHYVLTHFPEFEGTEAGFDAIKGFILKGGNFTPFVSYRSDVQILSGMNSKIRLLEWMHLICADISTGLVKARLQFFLGPEHVPATYVVSVGTHDKKVVDRYRRGHAYKYYRNGKKGNHDGHVKEFV